MKEKLPTTKNEIHPLLKGRWSTRSFSDKAISNKDLDTILEAASWSASSMNEQPWHYLVIKKGTPAFNKAIDALMGGNQPWSKNASVLLISLAKKSFERNGNANRHAMHDVGAANTTLLLQAEELEIYGHMMGGFHYDKALELFDLDGDKYEIACFIALGFLDSPEALEEPFKSREIAPRTRKAVREISTNL